MPMRFIQCYLKHFMSRFVRRLVQLFTMRYLRLQVRLPTTAGLRDIQCIQDCC